MKNIALVLAAIIPFAAAGQELATYSISTSITGMALGGAPANAGDRTLEYKLYFPAGDAEAADELFYKHLRVLLGDSQIKAFNALADDFRRARQ